MNSRPYQQCNRCVMDTTDHEITFDENGFCNHCTGYFDKLQHQTYQGKISDDLLKQIIQKIKAAGKGKDYDCVLGISGGIDSCYAAHILIQQGIRVLCVHMDNGWNSEISVKNILHIVKKLGCDYESFVLDWEEFKDLQLSFMRAGVPELETPTDVAIPAALHQVAAKHGIKYIISGGNYATEGILPKSWHYNAKDKTFLNSLQKQFGTVKLKSFPTFGFLAEMYYKFVKGIRMIYLLNYVPYDKEGAMKLLQEKLDWKYYGGKHYESKYTGFVQSFILPLKFHIDYRRATLSTQICAGAVNREEALEILKTPTYNTEKAEQEKEYICKKLGITTDDFDSMMKEPPYSYRDYPNSQGFLEFVYKTYRWLMNKN